MSRSATTVFVAAFLLLSLSSCRSAKPAVDLTGDPLPDGAVARCGTTRFRLGDYIRFAALSPDGKYVAFGGHDVELLDSSTGLLVRKIAQPLFSASAVAFSPDGKLIAIADGPGTIEIREFATGAVVRTIEAEDRHYSETKTFVFSADGRVLAKSSPAYGERGSIRAWDVLNGQLLINTKVLQSTDVGVAVSSDGKMLASWGTEFPLRLPFRDTQASSIESVVQLWNLQNGKELRRLMLKGTNGASGASFSPDSKAVAVATKAGPVVLFDVSDGKELRRIGGSAKSRALFGESVVRF